MESNHPAGGESGEAYEKFTISLPSKIKERIDRLATMEERTRSNWLAYHLARLLDRIEASSSLRVAESEEEYPNKNGTEGK
jgi:predicted transcriptional regulator